MIDGVNWYAVMGETAKLVAQFGGALFIAWCTVRWALKRFKSERTWDRKIVAIADLQSALWAMKRIADRRYNDAIGAIDLTPDYVEQLVLEWRTVEAKFRETASIARLFLPADAANIVETLEHSLATYKADSLQDEWETTSFEVDKAIAYFKNNPGIINN